MSLGMFFPLATTVFVLWQLGTTHTFEQEQLPGKRDSAKAAQSHTEVRAFKRQEML